jgi:hypothetical protein
MQLDILNEMKRDLQAQDLWTERGERRDMWRSEWWCYMLLFGTDPKKPLPYDMHLESENKLQETAGYGKKSGKTSLARTNNAHVALEKGMGTYDLSHLGGWSTSDPSAIVNYIDTAVKVQSALTMNGWDDTRKFYCARLSPDIPESLLCQVLPMLDDLHKMAVETYEKTKLDLSAVRFCETLKHLRQIYLESAVDLRKEFPQFPAYRHPVFESTDWRKWSTEEPARRKLREEVYTVQERDPTLAAMFQQHQESIEKLLESKLVAASIETAATAAAATATPLGHIVPVIPLFNSVQALYGFWDSTLRDFLKSNHNKVAWKSAFDGKTSQAKRVDKFKPLCIYIDWAATSRPQEEVIELIMDIHRESKSSMSAFVFSFKVLIQGVKTQDTNQPAFAPNKLVAKLEAKGLPEPPKTADGSYMKTKQLCTELGWGKK